MKRLDFYALPRTIQDRILDSCRGVYEPRPMAIVHGVRPKAELWGSLTVVAAVLLIALWAVGYGELDSALARHPLPLVLVFAGLAFAVGLGIAQALHYRAAITSMPMTPGVYLFPGVVVDAREVALRAYPLEEATDISPRGDREIVVTFPDARFTFPVDPGYRDDAVQMVEQARALMAKSPDEGTRRDYDPFVALSVPSPLAPTNPIEPPSPGWLRYRWAVPGVLALVGVGLFFARDAGSDTALFVAAKAANDVAAYQTYLAKGDAYREEVKTTLLPRAELQIAAAEGTVEAIDALRKQYPETAIEGEIDLARQAALVRAFEKARAEETLEALIAFEARYPDHHLGKDVAAAKHVLYEKAYAAFRQGLPERSGEVPEVAKALVDYVEKVGPNKVNGALEGPEVAVRVQRVPSKALDRADKIVRRNPYYNGESSLPTRYLEAEDLAPHEAEAAKAFAETLSKGFSDEIMTFAAGETVAGDDLPEVKVPTFFISFRLEPSGNAYASRKPHGIYMGLVFFFHVRVHIPGRDEPFVSKHVFDEPVPVKMLLEMEPPFPKGSVEEKLYSAIVAAGFDELQERYFSEWYR